MIAMQNALRNTGVLHDTPEILCDLVMIDVLIISFVVL
jgi:hypothetical protein